VGHHCASPSPLRATTVRSSVNQSSSPFTRRPSLERVRALPNQGVQLTKDVHLIRREELYHDTFQYLRDAYRRGECLRELHSAIGGEAARAKVNACCPDGLNGSGIFPARYVRGRSDGPRDPAGRRCDPSATDTWQLPRNNFCTLPTTISPSRSANLG
jgi:hypothetical protein